MVSRASTLNFLGAAAVGLTTVVVMAVPTDIIDTPWFSREVPVRWWEIPVLVAIGILVALFVGIGAADRGAAPAVGGATLATFAIGCPVCNKLVLAAVGSTGALNLWAPVQPVLAAASVALMAGMVVWRWRRRPCAAGACVADTQ
ncbi:hypothetical protein CRM90_27085 [Mycobacterium sp. ENV421]|uniref:hypothetical protein n=1 Tax=Mycobacterium sp. ENV421 TaxID=1213407 RepID=UPI000C9B9247|nr:hypothetical protein [Mycobacterium sp. ENV421]PND54612.1 hypothetical protein CRM90_27085 [Mycobacterium sp. ENV421]